MLGYKLKKEDSFTDTDGWKCPKELQRKRLDIGWISSKNNELVLALEHEGSNSPEKMIIDIRKLPLCHGLKVLVVYRQDTVRIQRIAAKELPKV